MIGSGFGGSLAAMIARRLGLSVLLLERGTHPRFAIGESTSPLTNLLLEQLARRYDLARLVPLTEYGKWQRTYPEIGCGLKRGFSFYAHAAGRPFVSRTDRANELLVAASPCDEVADTHWLRADVDHFLVREAQTLGVEYVDRVALRGLRWGPEGEAQLSGEREGQSFAVRARYVVDATGPRGFLARALDLGEAPFPLLPPTQALFTHFAGVHRWADLHAPAGTPPYPPDAAALHHLFDGGWIWVLRFDNGITSAGVAATDALAGELDLCEGAPAWERLLARFPSIREQFAAAEPVRPFVYSPRLSYRCAASSGPGWMLLPSAAAFVDPLFSTGIPLTLLGIERLGQALEEAWGTPAFDARVAAGTALSAREAAAAARLVGASYASFWEFSRFAGISMFYFAAASHSEVARRLTEDARRPPPTFGGGTAREAGGPRAHAVGGADANGATTGSANLFLRVDHPTFGPAFERLTDPLVAEFTRAPGALDGARYQANRLSARECGDDPTGIRRPGTRGAGAAAVSAAIEPLNIAGLCDPAKRNWYPVDLRDLIANAEKLGMSAAAMVSWIEAAGWNARCRAG